MRNPRWKTMRSPPVAKTVLLWGLRMRRLNLLFVKSVFLLTSDRSRRYTPLG